MNLRHTFFYLLILGVLLNLTQCQPTEKTGTNGAVYRIGFYNVENLFDTVDDPNTADEEFMPTAKKKWTLERYNDKLAKIDQIITSIKSPDLIGLCEVENKKVIEDLINQSTNLKGKYGIVHYESPDFRGIDVGLLYNQETFEVTDSKAIPINFPAKIVKNYTTRDILHVKGLMNKKEETHIFVNHWPSRRGGLKKSQPKRIFVAEQLNKVIKPILAANPKANIIIMGDMNDETDNKSVANVLSATAATGNGTLINCMADLDKEGKGTYNYKGNWNMLDQIILSPNLYNNTGAFQYKSTVLFQAEWMMFKSDKYGLTPSRTYGGPKYYGGYSDHLPVYVELKSN